jgi:hypothetical protein
MICSAIFFCSSLVYMMMDLYCGPTSLPCLRYRIAKGTENLLSVTCHVMSCHAMPAFTAELPGDQQTLSQAQHAVHEQLNMSAITATVLSLPAAAAAAAAAAVAA